MCFLMLSPIHSHALQTLLSVTPCFSFAYFRDYFRVPKGRINAPHFSTMNVLLLLKASGGLSLGSWIRLLKDDRL